MSPTATSEASRVNFRDLPSYRVPLYSIDMPLLSLKEWLTSMEEWMGLSLNPPFQRGYVWTNEQKSRYVEYLLSVGYSGIELHWNCPGWSIMPTGAMEIVDGKQRLSAVLDFLNNKIAAFGYNFSQMDGKPHIHARFKIKIADFEDPLDVANWYLALNTGGTYHTEEDIKIARDYRDSLLKEKE